MRLRRRSTLVAESDRKKLTPYHFSWSAVQMRALFADLPEVYDNALVITRRCAFFPQPRQPNLPAFPTSNGLDEETALRHAAQAGLKVRASELEISSANAKPYRDRLEFELETIILMGFAGYFLIVFDVIRWSKRQGIPVGPGCGSGGDLVVAWA